MYFVFDFDGTLFKTAEVWHQWVKMLSIYRLTKEEIEEAGENIFYQGFTPRRHAEALGLGGDVLEQLVDQYHEFLTQEGETLIFNDVFPFLEAHQDAHEYTLLTHGDPDLQHKKIEASGVGVYAEKIRISRPERVKTMQLKEMLQVPGREIIYIDDNPRELQAVHEAKLPIQIVRMVRKGQRHAYAHEGDGKNWKVISGLEELKI